MSKIELYQLEWFDGTNPNQKYITNFGPYSKDGKYGWSSFAEAEKQCNILNNANKTTVYKVICCE